jgi:nicotinamide-nucleotide adenylyltransferase
MYDVKRVKEGCPVCGDDVIGNEKVKYYCKACNSMYEFKHIEVNKNSCALFIGRFQPFHKGHLWAVKKILEENEFIIIAVGSSQYSNTLKNPFSFQERKQMIERSLKQENITNYNIVAIPDIHDHSIWVKHVMDLVKGFHFVYTGSELTRRLFSDAKLPVKLLIRKDQVSASEVRFRILKDMDFKHMLPETVTKYLKEINGAKRIKSLGWG